jgi:uncharacterized tellurite resistance protein B-like protein
MASENYQQALLHLAYLLINVDGVVNSKEQLALLKIKDEEKIPQTVFENFLEDVRIKKASQIYSEGIAKINACTDEEKLRVFVHLYKIPNIDGNVHIKEVKLLLYTVKMANLEFTDIITEVERLAKK